MKIMKRFYFVVVAFLMVLVCKDLRAERWSPEQAWKWYEAMEWPVGANFIPSNAINQLEMWQKETWDPNTIDRELGWAASMGMNTMRVYLHDIPFRADREEFLNRIDHFLAIAERHSMRILFVFFDGVWHPYPKSGKQPDPKPGVHNSGWVQSPGREILENSSRHDELKQYVQTVLHRYKDDRRVLLWDLFNEPDMDNPAYGPESEAPDMDQRLKAERAAELVEKAFRWAREVNPSQPLTVGLWHHRTWMQHPEGVERLSVDLSDVISFHSYDPADRVRQLVEGLNRFGRPIFNTEYMARTRGSIFESILPIFKEHKIAAYNWGVVSGKTQTIYAWGEVLPHEPRVWFHDIFRQDGKPFSSQEIDCIRSLIGRN